MDIKDKVALITGGTKGIGLGIAQSLLNLGLRVCITGRSQASIDKAMGTISSDQSDRIIGVISDVRNAETEIESVNATIRAFGRLDIFVANAGVGHFASIERMTNEQWRDTIDINLTGVFNGVKAVIPELKKSKGYIITIASLAGVNFFANGAAYNASKFGLVGFSQAIMLDLRDYDIKVTTIMPGSVATHFNNHTPSDEDDWKIQPEDVGRLVVDLIQMHPRTLPSKIEVRPSRTKRK